MARLYLRKTLTGFAPADEETRQLGRKYKLGEIYRAEVVKPRNYKHHRLAFALLNLTYQNQEKYTNFETFRKAVAIAAGHVDELITLDGEVLLQARSISFDSLDEVQFTPVMAAMMTVCCAVLGMNAPDLEAEISKYADDNYGRVA